MVVHQNSFSSESDDDVPLIRKDSLRLSSKTTAVASSNSKPLLQRRFLLPVLVVSLVALSFMFLFSGKEDSIVPDEVSARPKNIKTPTSSAPVKPHADNKAIHQSPPMEAIQDLVDLFQKGKRALYRKLSSDYGKSNFEAMFFTEDGVSRGRTIFRSPTVDDDDKLGWQRMKRKLVLKILQALLRSPTNEEEVSIVWATGGHSAAAAHGDLLSQSYTAVLESAVKDIFASLGINFIGRNYAVGGASSGPEIALCIESMFGMDISFLSWDFGMTDGDNYRLGELYFYRAARSNGRPALINFPRGSPKPRDAVLAELQTNGAATLTFDERQLTSDILKQVPDSFGLTQAEIDAMPPFVRNFQCEGKIESGLPYCSDEKFDNSVCPDRRFKTSWHPGWRWHAVNGNLMALLLVELVEEGLNDLVASGLSPEDAFAEMLSLEDQDYAMLMNADLPGYANDFELPSEITEMLYKEPNFCHMALVPSEIRYTGILEQVGHRLDPNNLPLRFFSSNVTKVPNESDEMRLVAELDQRQDCEVPLNLDNQDYFFVSSDEGWKQLVLPNDSEMRYYGREGQRLQGIVAVCFVGCPWNNCPKGNISPTTNKDEKAGGVADDQTSIEVNGKAVTDLLEIGNESVCHLLRHEGGFNFVPNEEGRFTIRVRLNGDKTYVRISSLIIW